MSMRSDIDITRGRQVAMDYLSQLVALCTRYHPRYSSAIGTVLLIPISKDNI